MKVTIFKFSNIKAYPNQGLGLKVHKSEDQT